MDLVHRGLSFLNCILIGFTSIFMCPLKPHHSSFLKYLALSCRASNQKPLIVSCPSYKEKRSKEICISQWVSTYLSSVPTKTHITCTHSVLHFMGRRSMDGDRIRPTCTDVHTVFNYIFANIEYFKPVSYTHLDVYKRQTVEYRKCTNIKNE